MKTSTVIRVPRTDADTDESILLRIEQDNPQRLDLALFGTDGENVYVGKTRHSTVEKLQSKLFSGSLEEWHTIISAKLLRRPEALTKPLVCDVELAATSGEQLTIVIRKNIDGITQRLGEVVLKQKDDEEISLFDWTVESAGAVDDLWQKRTELQSEIERRDEEIKALKEKVQGATQQHELHVKQLALKFSELLNSKKSKIRDQQRLLKAAKIAPSPGLDDHDESESQPRKPARGRKRKAENSTDIAQDPDEAMDNEARGDVSGAESARTQTPEAETSSDESDSLNEDEPPSKGLSASKMDGDQSEPAPSPPPTESPKELRIPPRRDLPFARPQERDSAIRAPQREQDADDEDTDDEL